MKDERISRGHAIIPKDPKYLSPLRMKPDFLHCLDCHPEYRPHHGGTLDSPVASRGKPQIHVLTQRKGHTAATAR